MTAKSKSHSKNKGGKNKRRKNRVKRLISTVINALIIIVLAFTASVVFQSHLFGNDKYILGFRSFVTLSDSMNPLIPKDSLIIIRRVNADTIQAGDIITYTEDSETLTQRVSEVVNTDGALTFITKGDAHEGVNSRPVTPDEIIGGFVYSVSHAGIVIRALRNPVYMSLCVAGVCVCFVVFDRLSRRGERRARRKKRRNARRRISETGTPINQWRREPAELDDSEMAIPSANA
jgi:signal peptidase